MRWLFLPFLLLCGIIESHAQYFDTLHIRYAIGSATLQAADRSLLDSLAGHNEGRKLLIYSYADYLGREQRNQYLSDNRANTVKDYLLKKGITPDQIMECTGLGQVPGSGGAAGNPDTRRTDIFIRRPKDRQTKTARQKTSVPEKKQPAVLSAGKGIPVAEQDDAAAAGKITHIEVGTLKVNEAIRLEHIGFYPGQADVLPSSYPELDNLYRILHDNPKLKVKLEGHVCCCIYPDGFFKDTPTWGLSVDRAYVVYKHMVARGIAPERMLYEGFGRTKPINDKETTSEEGQVNRRVEVRILEK